MSELSGFWLVVYIVLSIVVWCVLAAVAAFIAPEDRKVTFLLITLLILGPLGVLAAAVAQPRQAVAAGPPIPPTPAGRRRFVCPRCSANQNIPDADTSYDCWRCGEHRKVKPKAATNAPKRSEPLAKTEESEKVDGPKKAEESDVAPADSTSETAVKSES